MQASRRALRPCERSTTARSDIPRWANAGYQGWDTMSANSAGPSGEIEDTFIADLATGTGCGHLKSGAPARGERVATYS